MRERRLQKAVTATVFNYFLAPNTVPRLEGGFPEQHVIGMYIMSRGVKKFQDAMHVKREKVSPVWLEEAIFGVVLARGPSKELFL